MRMPVPPIYCLSLLLICACPAAAQTALAPPAPRGTQASAHVPAQAQSPATAQSPAQAPSTNRIYRCIGDHGEPAFSGQPCTAPGPQASTGATHPPDAGALGGFCATTPAELRDRIATAFQRDDVNLLAGSILWDGTGQSSARETLRSLAAFLKQPLVGIAVASAASVAGPALPRSLSTTALPAIAASTPAPTGIVVTTQPPGSGAQGPDTRDFGMTQLGDCWWLTL
jgi:hypothetical protein